MKQMSVWTLVAMLAAAMPAWGGEELSAEARDLESYLGLRIPPRIRTWVESKSDWIRRDLYSDEQVVRMNVMTEFGREMLSLENTDALVFLVLYRTAQGMDREIVQTPLPAPKQKAPAAKQPATKKPAPKKSPPGTNVVAVVPMPAEVALKERRDKFAATANELARKLLPMEPMLLQDLQ
jgi:hypothetical protein